MPPCCRHQDRREACNAQTRNSSQTDRAGRRRSFRRRPPAAAACRQPAAVRKHRPPTRLPKCWTARRSTRKPRGERGIIASHEEEKESLGGWADGGLRSFARVGWRQTQKGCSPARRARLLLLRAPPFPCLSLRGGALPTPCATNPLGCSCRTAARKRTELCESGTAGRGGKKGRGKADKNEPDKNFWGV